MVSQKSIYLIGLDFDGTIARTFQKSPRGIGVNEAYEGAVATILAPKELRHIRWLVDLGIAHPQN